MKNIMQVQEYNATIALRKYSESNKAKTVPSMFFFYLDNEITRRYGYNIPRQRGYVVYDENGARYFKNLALAQEWVNA
jgi:hypothetical protein